MLVRAKELAEDRLQVLGRNAEAVVPDEHDAGAVGRPGAVGDLDEPRGFVRIAVIF